MRRNLRELADAGLRRRAAVNSCQTPRVRVIIEGIDLPGQSFCDPDGTPFDGVHVAVQIGRDPVGLVRADAPSTLWELDVGVVAGVDGQLDFRGPAVHGKRGERFLYLTWGKVDYLGHFLMFRRAKLMLNRIEPELIRSADDDNRVLFGVVRLTDHRGGPRCARVDPPDLAWSAPTNGPGPTQT